MAFLGSGGSAEEIEFHVFLRDPGFCMEGFNLPRKNARNGIAPTLPLTKMNPYESRKKSWDKLHITEAIG